MANATITSTSGTQTANFRVDVSFGTPINGLDKTDVNLRALTENGITGIDFSISGTQPTANFVLMFTLPSNAQGSFEISMTGMVTPQGSSTPEAVMSNSVVVHYDTTGNVTATFGTAEYRDGGAIAVPVTFGEAVVVNAKTVFEITHVSGDDLAGIEYYLLGENTAYELVFSVPPDRAGSFQIAANGDVLKTATGVWDNVVETTTLTVAYNTTVPKLIYWDIPANYDLSAPVDVRVAYNSVVSGWHVNNTQTEIFILEGANLGSDLPYKWTGDSPPNFKAPVPADLTGTDWELLATPPAGKPTPNQNGFDADGQWHGVEAQYFLIRFPNPQEIGIFNLTPRAGGVRGPTGAPESIFETDYLSDGKGNYLSDGKGNYLI